MLTIALTLAVPAPLRAQLAAPAPFVPATPATPAADTARTSLTGVALSAPQQAALHALSGQTHGALTALYAQAGGRSGAPLSPVLRAAFDSVITVHNAALRALLTDAQRAVFDSNVRAVAATRRAGRRRPGAPPRAAAAGSAAPKTGGRP